MADSVRVGPAPPTMSDVIKRLMHAVQRQSRNEGGAAINPDDFPGTPGEPGAPGAPAYPVLFEYSVDGATSWHSTPTVSDNFMRTSSDNGATWSAAALYTGPTGDNGVDGAYIAVVYLLSDSADPAAPTGNGPIPSGWSGVPYSRAEWVGSHPYAVNNRVMHGGAVWNCDTAHTSSTWATDIAKWSLVSGEKLWVSRAVCAADNTNAGWSDPNPYLIVADYIKAFVEMASPTITGGIFRTAASGDRIEIEESGGFGQVRFYSGARTVIVYYGGELFEVTSSGGAGADISLGTSDGGDINLTTGNQGSVYADAALVTHMVTLTSADSNHTCDLIVSNSGVLQRRIDSGSFANVAIV